VGGRRYLLVEFIHRNHLWGGRAPTLESLLKTGWDNPLPPPFGRAAPPLSLTGWGYEPTRQKGVRYEPDRPRDEVREPPSFWVVRNLDLLASDRRGWRYEPVDQRESVRTEPPKIIYFWRKGFHPVPNKPVWEWPPYPGPNIKGIRNPTPQKQKSSILPSSIRLWVGTRGADSYMLHQPPFRFRREQAK